MKREVDRDKSIQLSRQKITSIIGLFSDVSVSPGRPSVSQSAYVREGEKEKEKGKGGRRWLPLVTG